MSEQVKTVSIVISVDITRYKSEDGIWMYDWLASNGDEPDEWFLSAEEAEADARNRYE